MSNTLEKTTFCRRRKSRGLYTGNVGGKVIRLMDRQIYIPADLAEAKFLMDDPEIEILCANEKEQKIENKRNESKGGGGPRGGGKK